MTLSPDPRLLALGERLWPGLKDQPPENQLATAAVQANFDIPAEALGEAILQDIRAFRDSAPQADDITLLLVARR